MEPDLAAFLARHTPQTQESAVWGGGTHPLRITAYLGHELPPLAYVTSVRSVVFHDATALVLRDRDGLHILPGGRREPGETIEETLRREVLEETGWTLRAPTLLGFLHFHHLSPRPPGHPYRIRTSCRSCIWPRPTRTTRTRGRPTTTSWGRTFAHWPRCAPSP